MAGRTSAKDVPYSLRVNFYECEWLLMVIPPVVKKGSKADRILAIENGIFGKWTNTLNCNYPVVRMTFNCAVTPKYLHKLKFCS